MHISRSLATDQNALYLQAVSRELGISDRVTWFGTVKNIDLPAYMRAATFLVLPSIKQIMGTATEHYGLAGNGLRPAGGRNAHRMHG